MENRLIDPVLMADWIEDNYLYQFHGPAKAIGYAWNAGENILLHGPGGYGKSVGAELAHKFIDYNVKVNGYFTMSFHGGVTEEVLLGGTDTKKIMDTGEIIYLLSKSFIECEFVVFEELFDAPIDVLLLLKDILTSGYVRLGNQVQKVKTRTIVACTNRSYEEIVEDDSTEALMQRFIFDCLVVWKTHEIKDYRKVLDKVLPANLSAKLSAVIFESNKKRGGRPMSPRTADKSAKTFLTNGLTHDVFFYIRGFDKGIVQKHFGVSIQDLEDMVNSYRNDDTKKSRDLSKKIADSIRNIRFNVSLTDAQMKRFAALEANFQNKLKNVVKFTS